MIAAAWTTYLAWTVVVLCCMALDALFCGMETGVYVLNKIRLDLRAEAGSRGARVLRRMLRKPDNLLAVLLIGTNLSRYIATAGVTTMFVLAGAGARSEWYTIALMTPVLFVVGDSVPKHVFRDLCESLTYRFAWFLAASNWLLNACGLAPLVRGFSGLLTRLAGRRACEHGPLEHEGLTAVVTEGRATGLLTHFQTLMADRVMHIGRVRLADVMIPMRDVVSAPREITRDELIERTRDRNYSRIPLLAGDGRVTGVLDIYDVLARADGTSPAEMATEPLILAADMPVTDALYRMQREHAAMAVVAEAGAHVGIVTVKDVVEEIVGELEAW